MNKQMEFTWIGINQSGKKISGNLFAKNKHDAGEKLCAEKITILRVQKKQAWRWLTESRAFSPKQRLDFTQQLHLLLQASIPLIDAFTLIIEHAPNKITQNILTKIKEKIISGKTFANALSDFPHYFDNTFTQMILIGEQSGQLEFVLSQLIANQEQRLSIKNKTSKMLFYPITVLCIAVLISIGLLIFVIPQFNSIYENFDAQLPSLTLALIHLSKAISNHATIIFFCSALLIMMIRWGLKKNNTLKNAFQKVCFQIAPLRSLYMIQQIAQWSQLMGMMLSSGVPMIETLQIANRIITQPRIQQQMQIVQNSVIAGESLCVALNHCPYFPKRAKYLISIGENADALDVMMKRLASIYQKQFENTLDHLSKLLEPVIMIGVASVISGLIIAMYLPIFRMGSVI